MVCVHLCSLLLLVTTAATVKTWLPNTNMNNPANWNPSRVPRDCDHLRLPSVMDIALTWTPMAAVVGITLPLTSVLLLPKDVILPFRDIQTCPEVTDITWTRTTVKGWLDPDNWNVSGVDAEWVPDTEKTPCTGETIVFPPDASFSVQLPPVQLPITKIIFNGRTMRPRRWTRFLSQQTGAESFQGAVDLRSMSWKRDYGCSKKCPCVRSPHVVSDWAIVEVRPEVFEEAVCLYGRQRCVDPGCYVPVTPRGHCCGICGSVLTVKDTPEGLDLGELGKKVQELRNTMSSKERVLVGVTRHHGDVVQVVLVARSPSDTIEAVTLATDLRQLVFASMGLIPQTALNSGLNLSAYIVQGPSGIFFGTFLLIGVIFGAIIYIYLVPRKRNFIQKMGIKQFTFSRFINVDDEAVESQVEIGFEESPPETPEIFKTIPLPEIKDQPPRSFDNPMFREPGPSNQGREDPILPGRDEPTGNTPELRQELNVFEETQAEPQDLSDMFAEIKF